jgi:predicted metalloprotease with PDZ domain
MRRYSILFTALFIASSLFAAPIVLHVDATGAPSNTFHAHLTIPATPGPMTLYYPKWIPGEHSPSGPIIGLTGLKITANGAPVTWQRDPVEMFAFHIDVPAGASAIDVDLDYLAFAGGAIFTSGASASPRLAVMSWNTVLLYPGGAPSDAIQFDASLHLPAGWKYATALETRGTPGEELHFEPVSLTRLVDSPVQMGTDLRKVIIPNNTGLQHTLNLLSESSFNIDPPAGFDKDYGRLVEEATALFGANHYRHYDWLLTVSDQVAHFGLEHHESSDDRTDANVIRDDSERKWLAGLMAHEYVHSWNGKYRRPAGLATPNYEVPMNGELLWVYEGLTEYLGELLPRRAGFWSDEEFRDELASTAAQMAQHVGRTWRPLSDTAVAAQTLYGAPNAGSSWRRGVDYYPEGTLLWLDVDMTIRGLTGGKKSLDDFCRTFYGGTSGHAELKPYTFDDIVNALNGVVAHDWRAFLNKRLSSLDPTPPFGGIEASGWRLVYNDKSNVSIDAAMKAYHFADYSASLGFGVGSNGNINDVIPNTPAAKAGITPGARIIAVNGRRYSSDALNDVVKASTANNGPIELILERGDLFSTAAIDYHNGPRWPHLERIDGKSDLLTVLGKPLAKK